MPGLILVVVIAAHTSCAWNLQMAAQLQQTQMDILGMGPTSGTDQQMMVKFREVDPFDLWVWPAPRLALISICMLLSPASTIACQACSSSGHPKRPCLYKIINITRSNSSISAQTVADRAALVSIANQLPLPQPKCDLDRICQSCVLHEVRLAICGRWEPQQVPDHDDPSPIQLQPNVQQ